MADDGSAIVNIVGERIALGPARRDLIPDYQRWMNDFETVRTLATAPLPIPYERHEEWYERDAKSETDVFFTVYERSCMRPIGGAGLRKIDHRNRRAEFDVAIGEGECRGKGYGTETTRLVLDYAFNALGLHNVMLTVFEYNPAGKRAYEKAGFKEFGRRRQCRVMGGKLWDEILMDCLATEFEGSVLREVFSG